MEKKLDLTMASWCNRKSILSKLAVDRTEGVYAAKKYLAEKEDCITVKEIILDCLSAIGVCALIISAYFLGCMM